MIVGKFTFSIPIELLTLAQVYGINVFYIARWYLTFKNVTGRSSYVAFELDLKRFLSFLILIQ